MKTISKMSAHGRMIETTIPIGDTKQVTICTMKRYNGIVSTTAQEETIEGDFISYSFGDWSACYVREKIRATEKAMLAQHETGLKMFLESDYYKSTNN